MKTATTASRTNRIKTIAQVAIIGLLLLMFAKTLYWAFVQVPASQATRVMNQAQTRNHAIESLNARISGQGRQ